MAINSIEAPSVHWEVVEHENERQLVGDQLEQPPNRAVRLVALVRERRGWPAGPLQGRQNPAQLALEVGSQAWWSFRSCDAT